MKNENKQRMLAEMDGYTSFYQAGDSVIGFCSGRENIFCGKYLNSYDAIIPLIVKVCTDSLKWSEFYYQLPHKEIFLLTPVQLADALIKATNKWQEDETAEHQYDFTDVDHDG